ncbi:hypothetical protein JWG42_12645 [Desulfoprunum benzoelyticum]|uniref:NodB homology domain-containing protein n=1 Tax=Desulfoprunum benzoelyticum TaxID=1506996 RepID=A0A840UMH7_9BACT|nr:hypothetical protein [Desulfoprunum benzoelyticum]MBB5346982.1 hypothetical protein [Desulfoprunum benzoelyticum]MBM9531000.1 hypothetical protein [Desulfoprunum benzoelyticum]
MVLDRFKSNEVENSRVLKELFQVDGTCFLNSLNDFKKQALSNAITMSSHRLAIQKISHVDKNYIFLNEFFPSFIWENLPLRSTKKIHNEINIEIFKTLKSSGIPLIQKWYWPNGCRSFFSFRADMDAGDEASLLRFVDIIRPWSKSLSLFVCGKAYVGKEHLLKEVINLETEVGNHTFLHYVFNDKKRNRKNLELTEALLSRVGVIPKGFVGPASFWHPSMYEVLEEKGYQYTSSFGVGHDDYPFFLPKNDSEAYSMVEIPFHCLGDRFPKFGFELGSEEVGRFFEQLLEKKYHSCEPMFIYGHPDMPGRIGDCPQLVKRICQKALSYKDVCTGNMADIAAWWRRRDSATANIEFDKASNRLFATHYRASPDVYWSIQVAADCKFLVSGQDLQAGVSLDLLDSYKKISLSHIPFANVGEVADCPPEKENLRKRLGNWRREYQRKRKMIHQLNTTDVQAKGAVV